MVLIAHISDLHVGAFNFKEDILLQAINQINEMGPDVVIVTGDLTENGYYLEFLQVASYLNDIESPLLSVPGNHDARHVGNESFDEILKKRRGTLTINNELRVIGLDSSEPDLDYGKIGRSQQIWMEEQLKKASQDDLYTVIALPHPIITVPKTGRERNVLADAGDVLFSIVKEGANIVISGHKHVTHLWRVENIYFATAGTLSSLKLRGKDINSYNTYYIEDDFMEIRLNQVQGKSYLLGSHKL